MSDAERDQDSADFGADAPDEGEVLEWVCHPLKRKPLVSVAVTLFIIAVGVTIYMTTYSRLFTVLGLVILLMSLAKFYFPTRFKLSDRGITIKTTTQTIFKEWRIYRSCYADKKGILLSPFVEPSRLENFRGLYVMFEGNAETVTSFVRVRIRRAHPEIDSALTQGPTA
jgi:hypothetical protein